MIDTVVPVKKTKKNPATVKLTPVRFSVTGESSNSVTLKPAGTPFTAKAGEISVTVGAESAAGASLGTTETLSIAKGGKRISLAKNRRGITLPGRLGSAHRRTPATGGRSPLRR